MKNAHLKPNSPRTGLINFKDDKSSRSQSRSMHRDVITPSTSSSIASNSADSANYLASLDEEMEDVKYIFSNIRRSFDTNLGTIISNLEAKTAGSALDIFNIGSNYGNGVLLNEENTENLLDCIISMGGCNIKMGKRKLGIAGKKIVLPPDRDVDINKFKKESFRFGLGINGIQYESEAGVVGNADSYGLGNIISRIRKDYNIALKSSLRSGQKNADLTKHIKSKLFILNKIEHERQRLLSRCCYAFVQGSGWLTDFFYNGLGNQESYGPNEKSGNISPLNRVLQTRGSSEGERIRNILLDKFSSPKEMLKSFKLPSERTISSIPRGIRFRDGFLKAATSVNGVKAHKFNSLLTGTTLDNYVNSEIKYSSGSCNDLMEDFDQLKKDIGVTKSSLSRKYINQNLIADSKTGTIHFSSSDRKHSKLKPIFREDTYLYEDYRGKSEDVMLNIISYITSKSVDLDNNIKKLEMFKTMLYGAIQQRSALNTQSVSHSKFDKWIKKLPENIKKMEIDICNTVSELRDVLQMWDSKYDSLSMLGDPNSLSTLLNPSYSDRIGKGRYSYDKIYNLKNNFTYGSGIDLATARHFVSLFLHLYKDRSVNFKSSSEYVKSVKGIVQNHIVNCPDVGPKSAKSFTNKADDTVNNALEQLNEEYQKKVTKNRIQNISKSCTIVEKEISDFNRLFALHKDYIVPTLSDGASDYESRMRFYKGNTIDNKNSLLHCVEVIASNLPDISELKMIYQHVNTDASSSLSEKTLRKLAALEGRIKDINYFLSSTSLKNEGVEVNSSFHDNLNFILEKIPYDGSDTNNRFLQNIKVIKGLSKKIDRHVNHSLTRDSSHTEDLSNNMRKYPVRTLLPDISSKIGRLRYTANQLPSISSKSLTDIMSNRKLSSIDKRLIGNSLVMDWSAVNPGEIANYYVKSAVGRLPIMNRKTAVYAQRAPNQESIELKTNPSNITARPKTGGSLYTRDKQKEISHRFSPKPRRGNFLHFLHPVYAHERVFFR